MPRPSAKSKILQAGLEVMHEQGFNGCSIQDITEAAGVPKGSFFNHFKTKEELALEILGPYGESSRMDLLTEGGVAPLDRLRRHFEYLADNYARHDFARGCLLGNFANELSLAHPQMRQALDGIYKYWSAAVAAVLREAIAENPAARRFEPDEMGSFLVNAWAGAVTRAKVMKNRKPIDEFFDVTFGMLLK